MNKIQSIIFCCGIGAIFWILILKVITENKTIQSTPLYLYLFFSIMIMFLTQKKEEN